MSNNNYILYIDNKCILCSKLVQWIIKIDKQKSINFCSLNSRYAVNNIPIKLQSANGSALLTVIYYDGTKYYQQSTAIIKMLRSLDGPWKQINVLYLVPKMLRDWTYRLIARNRYKLFGHSDVCLLESNIPIDRIII